MTDDLNPKGPSQPSLDQVYKTEGNPATKEPAERLESHLNAQSNAPPIDHRIPSQQATYDQATPTSVARGIRGAGPGEEAKGLTHEDVGRSNELDAEQMGASGEREVYEAVHEHPGASGSQPGLESDLERKKAEQAPLRQKVKDQRREDVDVGGVLGQRGGPADPVDQGRLS